MEVNPLIFIPSVREIPEVMDSWNKIPYDKFIVRMMLEPEAYKTGRDFFLDNKEYTHIVIAPDDMVLDYESFMVLKKSIEEYGMSNIAGLANIDESNPDVYSCKPLGMDPTSASKGTYYEKGNLPKETIFEVGFTGFACQWIDRTLAENLSFKGGCNEGQGCMDLQFTRECNKMNVSQLVNKNTYFYHMRKAQALKVRAWKNGEHPPGEGYVLFIRTGEMIWDLSRP